MSGLQKTQKFWKQIPGERRKHVVGTLLDKVVENLAAVGEHLNVEINNWHHKFSHPLDYTHLMDWPYQILTRNQTTHGWIAIAQRLSPHLPMDRFAQPCRHARLRGQLARPRLLKPHQRGGKPAHPQPGARRSTPPRHRSQLPSSPLLRSPGSLETDQ